MENPIFEYGSDFGKDKILFWVDLKRGWDGYNRVILFWKGWGCFEMGPDHSELTRENGNSIVPAK